MAYSQKYDNLAWQIASEVFGDSALAQVFYRMMKQESGFDSDVVEGRRASSAGAQGIAQFMPATAQEQGVDPLNPEEALRGAAAYLKKLIAYFGDQVAKGVAAYNAGAGRVEKAVAAGGPNWIGQLPAETQNYLAITQPEGGAAMPNGTIETGGIPRPQPPYQPPAPPMQASGLPTPTPENVEALIQAVQEHLRENPGDTEAQQYLNSLEYWHNFWRQEKRLPSQIETEADLTPLEREEIEARTALNRANARSIIAWDEGSTYEQMRQRMLDKLDQKQVKQENMISEFNAWMEGAIEARGRAETVYGEEMKRAAWTTPTEYFPGTEPGGARGQFAEKYGVPYTSSPGIATETLPNLDEMYGQWHGRMGISEQAPPTQGGWSGQGAPMGRGGAPQGGNASQAFLNQLRQRYAGQFGAGRA